MLAGLAPFLASLRWYASNFLNLRNDDSTQVVSLLHKFRMSKNFKADVLSFDIFEKSSILEILNYSKIFHKKTCLWLYVYLLHKCYHANVSMYVCISDESEPSWLKPGLELNNFQLNSAQLVTFSIQLGNFPIKARKLG